MSLTRNKDVNFHVHDVLAILKPFLWIITPLLFVNLVDARSKSNKDTNYYWRFKDEEGTAYRGEFENQCWFEEFVQRAIAECSASTRKTDISKVFYDEVICYKFDTYTIGRYDKHGDASFEKCLCNVMDAADQYCTEQAWIVTGYVAASIAAIGCCACICLAGYFCIKSDMLSDCFSGIVNSIVNGTQSVKNCIQSGWDATLSVFQPAQTSPADDRQQQNNMEMSQRV